MSEVLVIDSSVLAKWFLKDEEDIDLAEDILLDVLSDEVEGHIPRVALYEVCSLLTKACAPRSSAGGRRLTSDRAFMCIAEFWKVPFHFADLTEAEAKQVLGMAVYHSKQFYDMAYLRLAQQLGCLWCTADKKIQNANRPDFPSQHVEILSSRR